jgi:geranylgeranyl diphosphate synthase type II
MELKNYLNTQTILINRALKKLLPKDTSRISQSMRYSMFAGGKRLRPILVIEGSKICGGSQSKVIPAACAVEFIHTYSLIHDDLPAMDDDDLRRGMPTSHKKFNEATAILTGDALLTDAFRLISEVKTDPKVIINMINTLAEASGYKGMIGGQITDTLETDNWQKKNRKQAIKNISYIHKTKTAALIKASLLMGAYFAKAEKKQIKALANYGENIGLAFQIYDDVLDIIADKKLLGKKGSDKDNNKLTYPALFGLDKSKQMAINLVSKAKNEISIFGKKADILIKLADYIVERKY